MCIGEGDKDVAVKIMHYRIHTEFSDQCLYSVPNRIEKVDYWNQGSSKSDSEADDYCSALFLAKLSKALW